MGKAKRIPIAAGKRICQEYGYDEVVIYARKRGDKVGDRGKAWVTTYGKNATHCKVAAHAGQVILDLLNGEYTIVKKNPTNP